MLSMSILGWVAISVAVAIVAVYVGVRLKQQYL
jgi:hypothetical protein